MTGSGIALESLAILLNAMHDSECFQFWSLDGTVHRKKKGFFFFFFFKVRKNTKKNEPIDRSIEMIDDRAEERIREASSDPIVPSTISLSPSLFLLSLPLPHALSTFFLILFRGHSYPSSAQPHPFF